MKSAEWIFRKVDPRRDLDTLYKRLATFLDMSDLDDIVTITFTVERDAMPLDQRQNNTHPLRGCGERHSGYCPGEPKDSWINRAAKDKP